MRYLKFLFLCLISFQCAYSKVHFSAVNASDPFWLVFRYTSTSSDKDRILVISKNLNHTVDFSNIVGINIQKEFETDITSDNKAIIYVYAMYESQFTKIRADLSADSDQGAGFQRVISKANVDYILSKANAEYVELNDLKKNHWVDVFDFYNPNLNQWMPVFKQHCIGKNRENCDAFIHSSRNSNNQTALNGGNIDAARNMPSTYKVAYDRPNHIINGHFESDASNWNICPSANKSECDVEKISDEGLLAKKGRGSLAIHINNIAKNHSALDQQVNLKEGSVYRLSFFYKSIGNSTLFGTLHPSIKMSNNKRLLGKAPYNLGQPGWQFYEMIFRGEREMAFANLSLLYSLVTPINSEIQNWNQAIAFDDVQLTDVTDYQTAMPVSTATKEDINSWLAEGRKFIYFINPFGNKYSPYIKGNDNAWPDELASRKTYLINQSCGLYVYPMKSGEPNFQIFTYTKNAYYFSYWFNGFTSGGVFKNYFQPPTGRNLWIHPKYWMDQIAYPNQVPNSYRGSTIYGAQAKYSNVDDAIISETVPAKISEHCGGGPTSLEDLLLTETPANANLQIEFAQNEFNRTVYFLSPWNKDWSGNQIIPRIKSTEGSCASESVACSMTQIDPTCNLWAFTYSMSGSNGVVPNFQIYSYRQATQWRNEYISVLPQGSTTFKFTETDKDVWIGASDNTLISQTATINQQTSPPASAACNNRSFDAFKSERSHLYNPKLNESWSYHNSRGGTIFKEEMNLDSRVLTVAEVDGANRTTRTLLPVSLINHKHPAEVYSIPDLEQKAKDLYGQLKGHDGALLINDKVWSSIEYEANPLGRVKSSLSAGEAFQKVGDERATQKLYGCAKMDVNAVITTDQTDDKICSTPSIDNLKYEAVMSPQRDGWTYTFYDAKSRVVAVERRTTTHQVLAQTLNKYDNRGNLTQVTHPTGPNNTRKVVTYVYDDLNRLIVERDPTFGEVRKFYSSAGVLKFTLRAGTSVIPASQTAINHLKYDIYGRVIESGYFIPDSFRDTTREHLELLAEGDFNPEVNYQYFVKSRSYYDKCERIGLGCAIYDALTTVYVNPSAKLKSEQHLFRSVQEALLEMNRAFSLNKLQTLVIWMNRDDGIDLGYSDGQYIASIGHDQPNVKIQFESQGNTPTPQVANFDRTDYIGKLTLEQSWDYEYNSVGNPNRLPIEIAHNYDFDGNEIETLQFIPWLSKTSEAAQRITREYDHLGRLTKTQTYRNNGNVELSKELYEYDNKGRLVTIKNDTSFMVQNKYNDLGFLTQRTINDPSRIGNKRFYFNDFFYWHPLGMMTTKNSYYKDAINPVHSEVMHYEDHTENPRYDGLLGAYLPMQTNGSRYWIFPRYDDLGRLYRVDDEGEYAPKFKMAAKYAPDGSLLNLQREREEVEGGPEFTYNVQGQLESVQGKSLYDGRQNVIFSYDHFGRLTNDVSKGLDIEYPLESDMPIEFDIEGKAKVEMGYLGAQRFAKRSFKTILLPDQSSQTTLAETRFYLLGGKEVRLDPLGSIKTMHMPTHSGAGRLNMTISPTSTIAQREFFIKDRLGSTVRSYVPSETSPFYTTSFAADYDAWGREITGSIIQGNTPEMAQRYTGKEKDAETNLDYFGARYLDKDFGMWLTPDPARQYSNLYRRTVNPYNFVDPNGLYERYASFKPTYIDLPNYQILSGFEQGANSAFFAIDQLSMLFLEASYSFTEDLADMITPDVVFASGGLNGVGVIGAATSVTQATFKDGQIGTYVTGGFRLGMEATATASTGIGYCFAFPPSACSANYEAPFSGYSGDVGGGVLGKFNISLGTINVTFSELKVDPFYINISGGATAGGGGSAGLNKTWKVK
jgi:RHS repeat-associated protein